MPRQLTEGALAAAFASNTDVVFILLMSITPKGENTLYFCNNNEPVLSRGRYFNPVFFEVVLPTDSSSELPSVKVSIDNVDQALVDTIRRLTDPPEITLEVVTNITPDITELEVPELTLQNVSWTAETMTADLNSIDIMNLSWPADEYTPGRFPGLF